jgi:hypothetical protein
MFSRRSVIVLAFVTATAVLPSVAAAQDIAVKAGINLATLSDTSDFPDTTTRMGAVGGLAVRVPAGERFSFQVEGLFSEKGLGIEISEGTIDASGDIRIRYLEVPILGRVDVGTPGSSTRFYLVAGAAPAFKLSARLHVEALDEEDDEDLSDDVESMDLGLVGGAGVEFGRMLVEARYTYGLRSIAKGDEGDEPEDIKNRVFSVMVGFRFR